MRKCILLSVMLMAAMCLVSCSDSPDTLSASTAKKLFKKEVKRLNQLDSYADVQIGYFECNDNDLRYTYRQLAANEIITYNVKKVMKPERVKKTRLRQSYWGGTYKENYWTTEDVPVYFVTTALTEKGKKLVYEEKEAEPSEDEKELRLDFEVDKSKFPEFAVKEEEFPDKASADSQVESAAAEADAVTDEESHDEYDEFQPDTDNASEYEREKGKEAYESVKLQAYTWSIEKARNIQKTGDYTAEAEIIAEVDKATPVGRIVSGRYEGQRILVEKVKFIFYQDKGWTLDKSERSGAGD